MIKGAPLPQVKSKPLPLRAGLDWQIIVVCGLLLLFGLLMVTSSSGQLAAEMKKPITHFLVRQILFLSIGIVAAYLAFRINYQTWSKFILVGVAGVIVLLVLAKFAPKDAEGVSRGLWQGSIQPSEFAKLVIIAYLSIWMTSRKDTLNHWGVGLGSIIAIVGFMAGLVVLLPDYSAAATLFIIGLLMFFLCGGHLPQMVAFGGGIFGLAFMMYFLSDTVHNRLAPFFAGIADPTHSAEQVRWAFEAIINGGIFGMGIGRSLTKYLGLPVAHTDSIFAIIVEETGLLGALFVIACFAFLLWRGLKISRSAPDEMGKLLAQGITFWIVLEACINMGTMVGIVPIAGNTLPLISYGGSSLITTLVAIGILLNISHQGASARVGAKGGTYGAVVNLRRGDRRRSIPRPVRPSGS